MNLTQLIANLKSQGLTGLPHKYVQGLDHKDISVIINGEKKKGLFFIDRTNLPNRHLFYVDEGNERTEYLLKGDLYRMPFGSIRSESAQYQSTHEIKKIKRRVD